MGGREGEGGIKREKDTHTHTHTHSTCIYNVHVNMCMYVRTCNYNVQCADIYLHDLRRQSASGCTGCSLVFSSFLFLDWLFFSEDGTL